MGTSIGSSVLVTVQGGEVTFFATKAAMDADLEHADGKVGVVFKDPVLSNNRSWSKNGAPGNGAWEQVSDRLDTAVGNDGGGFLQPLAGAILRTLSQRSQDIPVSILDFHYDTDGSDFSPALQRALMVSKTVMIPGRSYTFLTPVEMIDGMELMGPRMCRSGADLGDSYIYAPNGFLINSNTTRRNITVRNLHIHSDAVSALANLASGSYAINGPFGGLIHGCKFQYFDNCIRNPDAFLSRYTYNSFDYANVAINMADSNLVRIEDNHFNSTVNCAITNQLLTPIQGGNYGMPITIIGNNFNVSSTGGQGQYTINLRGTIVGFGNYFEDFGGVNGDSNAIFFNLVVGRFDNASMMWFGNQMNGQGKSASAFYINGTVAGIDNPANVSITHNLMIGFKVSPFQIGPNNILSNLRISPNTYSSGATPVTGTIAQANRPFAQMTVSSTTTSIAGATYLPVPFDTLPNGDNTGGFDLANNRWVCRKAGSYRITVDTVITTSAADYPAVEMVLYANGVNVGRSLTGLKYISAPTYGQLRVEVILPLAAATIIQPKMRNGDKLYSAVMTVEWLGDGNN